MSARGVPTWSDCAVNNMSAGEAARARGLGITAARRAAKRLGLVFRDERRDAAASERMRKINANPVFVAASHAAQVKPIRPIRVDGDVAYVTLTKGYEAIIDSADAATVERYNWHAKADGRCVYAIRHAACSVDGKKTTISLHRSIMGEAEGLVVDHINGDGLDNRRTNLRWATRQQNTMNRFAKTKNITGFKGVRRANRSVRWTAVIGMNGKSHYLGAFDTPEDAYAAYCAANAMFHGEFGRVE